MPQPLPSPLDYFAHPGPTTDPKDCARLLETLPPTLEQRVRVVQGLLVHIFWAERYGLCLSKERQGEVQLRLVSRQLQRLLELDDRPLVEARPLEKRLVGNCRDFTVMLCAMLRNQGIPARARCGFGTYFLPNRYEDHWVCEYWNAGQKRWVLVDAQLDALQREVLHIAFDPLDVPRDQFVVAGQAWRICRAGQADPDTFGIHQWHGMGFILGNLMRDFFAFHKIEILPWDPCGAIEKDFKRYTPAELEFFDCMADLTLSGNEHFAEIYSLYENDPRLRVPADVLK
ncbi:MAG TPA: transglutaminase-like domain-containing protein [Aggregatilineales bacterium]|nr:transglutaminase-like domain-containing protein [Aggregatilineales bacterium]